MITPIGGPNPRPLFLGGFVSYVSAQYVYVAKTIENFGDTAMATAMDSYGAGIAAASDIISAAGNLATGNISGATVDLGKALTTYGGAEVGAATGGLVLGPLGAALGAAAGALAGQVFGGYAGNFVNGLYSGSGFEDSLGNMTGAISGSYASSFSNSNYGIQRSFGGGGGGDGNGGSKLFEFSI
ncbi:MAG: hypothetical protein ACYCZB_12650 [Acidiphilium sp.]